MPPTAGTIILLIIHWSLQVGMSKYNHLYIYGGGLSQEVDEK